MHPDRLERYAFLWSELRLLFAAVALLIGGKPVLLALPLPFGLFGFMWNILHFTWIISGIAVGYLCYRWLQCGKRLFGKQEKIDRNAFLFLVVTGINLGLTGLFGTNIGMSLVTSKAIYFLAGVVYLLVAAYLWKRWKEMGQIMFR